MGNLKPGATYIYESPDRGETVYAREQGSNERTLIGQSWEAYQRANGIIEDNLWREMREAAKTNTTLQKAMEQCIIIYNLSREDAT